MPSQCQVILKGLQSILIFTRPFASLQILLFASITYEYSSATLFDNTFTAGQTHEILPVEFEYLCEVSLSNGRGFRSFRYLPFRPFLDHRLPSFIMEVYREYR